MKVKFAIEQEPIMGYLNVDPFPHVDPDEAKNYMIHRSNFRNVGGLLIDAECSEIIVDNVLSSLQWDQIYEFLQTVCKKLSHNGQIIIQDMDLMSIVNAYKSGTLTTPEFNKLVFGSKHSPWGTKNSNVSMVEIAEMLQSFGLIIEEQIYVSQYYCIVKGRRP